MLGIALLPAAHGRGRKRPVRLAWNHVHQVSINFRCSHPLDRSDLHSIRVLKERYLILPSTMQMLTLLHP